MDKERTKCSTYTCLKVFFLTFNILYLTIGCVLLGLGAWSFASLRYYESVSQTHHILDGAVLLMVLGSITLIVCILGVLSVVSDKSFLMLTYFVMVLLLILSQVVISCVIYFKRHQIDNKMQEELLGSVQQRYRFKSGDSDDFLSRAWDDIQQSHECCGVHSSSDWSEAVAWNYTDVTSSDSTSDRVPDSCCVQQTDGCGSSQAQIYTRGCYSAVKRWFSDRVYIFGSAAIGVAVTEILGLVMVMSLYCLKRQYRYERVMQWSS